MGKTKGKILIIAGVVFFVCILSFFIIKNNINSKSFDDFFGTNNPNIMKVRMVSGNTGKSVSTDDKIKIQELVNLLKSRSYNKTTNQKNANNFSYSYSFYI